MPTITEKNKDTQSAALGDGFISDAEIAGSDFFIPDVSIGDEDDKKIGGIIFQSSNDPVRAKRLAEQQLEEAKQDGFFKPVNRLDNAWTEDSIDDVKKEFYELLNPGGNPLRLVPVSEEQIQQNLKFWWQRVGWRLPPEILTELGIDPSTPTPEDILKDKRVREKAEVGIIRKIFKLDPPTPEEIQQEKFEQQLELSEGMGLPGFQKPEPKPQTMDLIKAASNDDIDFLDKFVDKTFLDFPDDFVIAIKDEKKIRDHMPIMIEDIRDRPLMTLIGTDFFNKLGFGLAEFTSRKGFHPAEFLPAARKGDVSIRIRTAERIREMLAKEDPSLLTAIGLNSGEILADIAKFAVLPDVSKIKHFSKLSKAAKAALGVGTKAALIELLEAPEIGETFDEKLESTAIAGISGAIAGTVFSLALSGIAKVGAAAGKQIGKLKVKALRKALIKKSPKLEAYIQTLSEEKLDNLRNAVNDSVKVQTGEMTQAVWDTNHKPFVTALAKDAIRFTQEQAAKAGRPGGLVPKGFRAGFAELGDVEPGKKLIKKAVKKGAEQLAAQAKALATIPGTKIQFDEIKAPVTGKGGENVITLFKEGKKVHQIKAKTPAQQLTQAKGFDKLLIKAESAAKKIVELDKVEAAVSAGTVPKKVLDVMSDPDLTTIKKRQQIIELDITLQIETSEADRALKELDLLDSKFRKTKVVIQARDSEGNVLRDSHGNVIGTLAVDYDGTAGDAVKKAKILAEQMSQAFPGVLNIQSLTVATDSEGNFKFAISPDFKIRAELDKVEAAVAAERVETTKRKQIHELSFKTFKERHTARSLKVSALGHPDLIMHTIENESGEDIGTGVGSNENEALINFRNSEIDKAILRKENVPIEILNERKNELEKEFLELVNPEGELDNNELLTAKSEILKGNVTLAPEAASEAQIVVRQLERTEAAIELDKVEAAVAAEKGTISVKEFQDQSLQREFEGVSDAKLEVRIKEIETKLDSESLNISETNEQIADLRQINNEQIRRKNLKPNTTTIKINDKKTAIVGDELFTEGTASVEELLDLQRLSKSAIHIAPDNPKIAELQKSISQKGFDERFPISIIRKEEGSLFIREGNKRLIAADNIGLTEIPVQLIETSTQKAKGEKLSQRQDQKRLVEKEAIPSQGIVNPESEGGIVEPLTAEQKVQAQIESGKKKIRKAPAATKGEPRELTVSRNEQLEAEILEMEKWQQQVTSGIKSQQDPDFARHLEKEIAKKRIEIASNVKDRAKVSQALRDKTFDPKGGRPIKEIAGDAAKNLLDIGKSVPDMFIKIFEPAKLVEKRLGPNAYSTVIRGIMLPEVRALEFNEQVLDAVDTNFGELEEFFSKFSSQDLKNFMLSRGKPRGEIAQELQKIASVEVPEELRDPRFEQAIKQIADYNFTKLKEIADGDVTKVRDYFYGIYKQDNKTVDQFLDKYYRTTKRFLEEKKLPTVADAAEFGLTLKSNNPVTNLKSEWAGISRLEGMQLMRDELMRFGEGEFIGSIFKDIPPEWVKIGDEPVFKDLRADPDLARLINNLISVNKISQWAPLRVLRGINNVLRIFKFAGSAFHLTVEASQAIADTPILNPASAFRGFNTGFNKNDAIFKTPEYRDYIGLGGGQSSSIEAEAQSLFSEIVQALGSPGAAFKTAITPLRIVNTFTEWMFNNYIPKLKYAKYLDFVAETERRLGRGLTDNEKINIIKEGQNFYGEMNEKLFGRSGTVTSALRFIFLAPGFAEGNYRTIGKGLVQWGIGDTWTAKRSRRNVVNSLLLKLAAATVGTMILTGKAPKKPENVEDIRDLFKIDTGKKDDRGRDILIDTLTYDKDYYNLLFGWAQKGTTSLGKEILRRVGGMRAPIADMAYDLVTVAFNKDIYDWKGDTVIKKTDPILTRLRALAMFELKKTEPISASVFRQGLSRGMNFPVAALQAITGVRPTLREADIRRAEVLRLMYELWGEREEVFISVRTASKPRGRIAAYNKNVDRILSSKKVDPDIREEFGNELPINTEKFLANKEKDYQSTSHTLKESQRIRELLVNFKIEPKGIWEVSEELSKRLSTFTETRRRLNSKVDDGFATPDETRRSIIFNGLQSRISKVNKVLAKTEDPDRSEQLVDVIENMLTLSEQK